MLSSCAIDKVTLDSDMKLACLKLSSFVYHRLVGDVLLCTGFLSYSGPFNQEYRNHLLGNWEKELHSRRIPFTPELNLTANLVDTATVSVLVLVVPTFTPDITL